VHDTSNAAFCAGAYTDPDGVSFLDCHFLFSPFVTCVGLDFPASSMPKGPTFSVYKCLYMAITVSFYFFFCSGV
jgi:hypothetical protein